jgi:HEPN domain-containing protein
MNKQEIIEFWITSSDDNYKSMLNMLKAGEYMWALFIGHLVIEKLLKAYYLKISGGDVPRTRDLLKLAVTAGMEINETMKDNLQYITLFNIETRYEEYKREFHKKCTRKFAHDSITKIKGIKKWLKEKLKN